MRKPKQPNCTCRRRYWICAVPLAWILAVILLGSFVGVLLFPSTATPRTTVLDVSTATVPTFGEVHAATAVSGSSSEGTAATAQSKAAAAMAMRYAALVKWSGGMFFSLVLFCATIAVAFHIIVPALREGCQDLCFLRHVHPTMVWLTITPALIGIYVLSHALYDQSALPGIWRALLESSVHSDMLIDMAQHWDCIGMCVVVMMALAAGATINMQDCGRPRAGGDAAAPSVPAEPAAQKAEIKMLERQTSRLRLMLYAGAIVLLFSLFEVSARLHLGTAFASITGSDKTPAAGTVAAGVDAIVESLLLFRALLYTLFLVALYVPAAAIIRKRAVEVARAVITEDSEAVSDKWLADHGLTLAPLDLIKPIIAIASPLLAVPFGELINKL